MNILMEYSSHEVEVDCVHWEEIMSQPENLKATIKKLSSRATKAKMDLHDLAEDLPIGWEKIPDVAQEAYEAYRDLIAARELLAITPGG